MHHLHEVLRAQTNHNETPAETTQSSPRSMQRQNSLPHLQRIRNEQHVQPNRCTPRDEPTHNRQNTLSNQLGTGKEHRLHQNRRSSRNKPEHGRIQPPEKRTNRTVHTDNNYKEGRRQQFRFPDDDRTGET